MQTLVVVMDALYSLVFFIFITFFWFYASFAAILVERQTIEISDYSIKLKGFPRDLKY